MPEEAKKPKTKQRTGGSYEATTKTVRGFIDLRDTLIKDLEQDQVVFSCRMREALNGHLQQRQELQAAVQQRFDELHKQHWEAVGAMSCEERSQPKVVELQRQLDSQLAQAQETTQQEWVELEKRQHKEAEDLAAGLQQARTDALATYIDSLKSAWAAIDGSLLDGAALGVVAQSIAVAAQAAGPPGGAGPFQGVMPACPAP